MSLIGSSVIIAPKYPEACSNLQRVVCQYHGENVAWIYLDKSSLLSDISALALRCVSVLVRYILRQRFLYYDLK